MMMKKLFQKIRLRFKGVLPERILWFYREFSQKPDQFSVLNQNKYLRKFDIGYGSAGYLKVTDDNKGHLKIGKYCSFARGCTIMLAGEHATDWATTYHAFHLLRPDFLQIRKDVSQIKGDVEIGHDVWCGAHSVIMSGVKIGNGAIIGAHSVVRRDIPPYAIVLGNPARPVGFRFPADTIEKLERISWWDWSLDKIKAELHLLHSDKVDEFIARHYESNI